jgi:hypothetical protein
MKQVFSVMQVNVFILHQFRLAVKFLFLTTITGGNCVFLFFTASPRHPFSVSYFRRVSVSFFHRVAMSHFSPNLRIAVSPHSPRRFFKKQGSNS